MPSRPPLSTVLGQMTTPDAVTACTALSSDDADVYYSFDLHFDTSRCSWECVRYFNPNTDASYFNVDAPDVVLGLGYSLKL